MTWGRGNFRAFTAVIARLTTSLTYMVIWKSIFSSKAACPGPLANPILPSPILEFERNHVVPCSSDRGPQKLLGGALLIDAEPKFSITVDSPGEV